MLVINYNGKKPSQKEYDYAVVGNSNANVIRFVLQSSICSGYTLQQISNFDFYVKMRSAGSEYIDKVMGEVSFENDLIIFDVLITKKMTHWKNLSLQVQIEANGGLIVAQTEIVCLELSGTISVDKEMSEEYPEAIQQLEGKVNTFDRRITDVEEKVVEAKEVIITKDINKYVNESGVNKIVRKEKLNGEVKETFLIDKIHHKSTLVQANADTSYSDEELDGGSFKEIFGENDFRTIFGEQNSINFCGAIYTLYYDQSSEITKGARFGLNDFESYGSLGIEDCTPNQIVRVIVGKYFEYDEQGNKVFDEHSAIYSENFADIGDGTKEITEERQVFEVKINDSGSFYFDSDGGEFGFGNTRFILYGFEIGEEAHDEYKAREIGGGGKYLPTFKQTDKVQVLYDYFLEHKNELDDGITLNFAILGDDNQWGVNTTLAYIQFIDDEVNFAFNDWNGNYFGSFDKNEILEETIYDLMDNYTNRQEYAFYSQLPQEWYGTQAQYDALTIKDPNTTYYIYEE